MKDIRELGNVDVYVIDQLLKGTIRSNMRLLDAGCGTGRNFSYFARNNFNITGIDPNKEYIRNLQRQYPNYNHQLHISSIEEFHSDSKFDAIICNAVLHFANNHNHFETMFVALSNLLDQNGILFIRMTTDHGMLNLGNGNQGVFELPDESIRYLLSRNKLEELRKHCDLKMIEPFKSVLVENWRSMATIVLQKH